MCRPFSFREGSAVSHDIIHPPPAFRYLSMDLPEEIQHVICIRMHLRRPKQRDFYSYRGCAVVTKGDSIENSWGAHVSTDQTRCCYTIGTSLIWSLHVPLENSACIQVLQFILDTFVSNSLKTSVAVEIIRIGWSLQAFPPFLQSNTLQSFIIRHSHYFLRHVSNGLNLFTCGKSDRIFIHRWSQMVWIFDQILCQGLIKS